LKPGLVRVNQPHIILKRCGWYTLKLKIFQKYNGSSEKPNLSKFILLQEKKRIGRQPTFYFRTIDINFNQWKIQYKWVFITKIWKDLGCFPNSNSFSIDLFFPFFDKFCLSVFWQLNIFWVKKVQS
jgi:hypothetical protein